MTGAATSATPVRMTLADVDAVLALEQRIQTDPWTAGNFRDSLMAGHAAWVQHEAGALIAFAVTMRGVDEDHLLLIGVAPERQRQGCGAQLLAFLQDEARRAGMVRMLLEVRASNTAALAFYQHAAFTEIGRRRAYYAVRANSAGREDAIVMARTL